MTTNFKQIFSILLLNFKIFVQQECTYSTGIEMAGSDLLNKPLIVFTITQCCNLCLQQPNCQAWNVINEPGVKKCFLKYAVGPNLRYNFLGYYGVKKTQTATQAPMVPAPVTYNTISYANTNPTVTQAPIVPVPATYKTIPFAYTKPTTLIYNINDLNKGVYTVLPTYFTASQTSYTALPATLTYQPEEYTSLTTTTAISPITTRTTTTFDSHTPINHPNKFSTPPVIIFSSSYCFYTLNTAYNLANQDGQIMGSIGNIKPDTCCNICGMYSSCHGFNYDKKNILCTLLTNIDKLSMIDDENFDTYGVISRNNK